MCAPSSLPCYIVRPGMLARVWRAVRDGCHSSMTGGLAQLPAAIAQGSCRVLRRKA